MSWRQLPYPFSPNAPLVSGAKPGDAAYFLPLGGRLFLPILLEFTFGGTSAQDVNLWINNFPLKFKIVDAWIATTTAVGSATITLRSATGGGGTAYTSAISVASTTAISRNQLTALATIPVGGSLYARKNAANAPAGTIFVLGRLG